MGDFRTLLTSDAAIATVFVVCILVTVFVLIRMAQAFATRRIDDTTTRYRARKVVGFVGLLFAGLVLAVAFSDYLGPGTFLLGGIGAGVAFALQEVIGSLAGWAAISFGGWFKIGDRIQLGGMRGDVIDIGLLRTTIMELGQWVHGDQYNGRVVRVANSFVFKEPVVNYSGDFPFLWDEIVVPVRFGSDMKRATAILAETAREICHDYEQEAAQVWRDVQMRYVVEDASTAPMVSSVFDSNWVTFTLRYVVRFDRRVSTKHLLSARVLESFDATGGAVRVAISSVEMIPGKPIEPA